MLFDVDDLISQFPFLVTDYQPVVSHFDDATHCVYKLNSSQGYFALKTLKQNTSAFWRGMQSLFDIHLEQQIKHADQHYAGAAKLLSVHTPKLVAYAEASQSIPAYVVTEWLEGHCIDPNHIPLTLIESLACADAQRHQQQSMTWGSVIDPGYSMMDWQARIAAVLPSLTSADLACVSADDVFVPMIMDMRWDQCLQQQGRFSALVDIDALVFAPKAIELLLMEYWLTAEQLRVWRYTYLAYGGQLPVLCDLRPIYRQLLWSWQIMGPMSQSEWMHWPTFFD